MKSEARERGVNSLTYATLFHTSPVSATLFLIHTLGSRFLLSTPAVTVTLEPAGCVISGWLSLSESQSGLVAVGNPLILSVLAGTAGLSTMPLLLIYIYGSGVCERARENR